MGSQMMQSELLGKIMFMITSSGVCPDTPIKEWPKIILQAHRKGYLWVNKDANIAVCAYRIPEWDEKWSNEMPEEESGTVMYIPWAVSQSHNPFELTFMLKRYIDANKISEVVYYKRNSDKNLKRIKIKENICVEA